MNTQIFKNNFFTWNGRANLVKNDEPRIDYLKAIREADKENIQPLIDFAKRGTQ